MIGNIKRYMHELQIKSHALLPTRSIPIFRNPIVRRIHIAHLHPYRHRRSLLNLLIISTPTTTQQRSFPLIFSLSSFSTSTPAKPLLPPLRALAMASDGLSAAVTAAEDEKFGFKRSEMFKEKLAGTVNAYDRHVFLCYKTPEAWPSRVEGSESDPLPKFFASALKARKNDIAVKTLLTVIEGREGTEFSDGDVLIFPQMIKCRGLKESDVDSFVDDVLVNHKPWASGVQEPWTGPHVFICAHMSRNEWYRVWARNLIDKFKEEVELRGLMNQVFVAACYHSGAHDDNLIIYSPGSDGSITGQWYRFVTPYDVPELLDQHIGKGEIIERHWRGQIGASADEAEKIDDQKLPNGGESKIIKKSHENGNQTMSYVRVPFHFDDENYQTCTDDDDDENYQTCITLGPIGASSDEAEEINDRELPNGEENKKIEEKPQENGIQIHQENGDQIQNNENFSDCCHGANSDGFTCCNEVSLENGGSGAKKLKETRESCALGKLSSLIGNWEQSDVLAAAAVVGAMASVAVAYIFYRRSSRKML